MLDLELHLKIFPCMVLQFFEVVELGLQKKERRILLICFTLLNAPVVWAGLV